ncbi:MAG: c-type cytochrome [Campylobacterales bacterium]|nr:c-type cytochrome [Campylobacterales bacterium]
MKKIVTLVAVLGLSTLAMADAFTKCAGCHGASGEKAALGKSKIIGEMSKADITAAIKGYKDGSYGGPMKGLMVAQVKDLTDADVAEITAKIGK